MAIENVTLHIYRYTDEFRSVGLSIENYDYRPLKNCMKDRVHLGEVEVQLDVPDADLRPCKSSSSKKRFARSARILRPRSAH